MMDEEIRQALNEVREMKQMCGNINMKLTNIVTQRGQDIKKKLEAEYQRGFEDGKKEAESSEAIEQVKKDAFNKGMLFKEEKIHDAFLRGVEKGKAVNDKGCEGCKYAEMGSDTTICAQCCNGYPNQWTAKDDEIEVGDEVKSLNDSGVEIEGLLPWVVTTVDQGDYCQGIDSKGEVHATKKVRACKTGRHFDIQKILEDMKHD